MAWSVFALTLVLGVSCGRPPVTNRAKLERQEAVERHQAQIDPPAINLSNSSLQSFCQQRLDHFNKTNQKTWCQRFAVDDSFYQRGERSVVFLCVGGEDRPWGTSGWPHLQTCNNMVQLAPRFNALLLCLEHRHYGGYDFDAVPKFDLEGLHFLSSRQALEDVAAFRVYAAEVLDLQTAAPWRPYPANAFDARNAWP
ncbi:Thymus-specific serine protease (Serine protease 16) [Durusdinium trenchii]|uniref:Thymus-specific serine protease (Serine protease 16) n=1 Tax=Durusdinium trenchii TaxID=1381693 RepID=A0ABP0LUP9_9DINO